MIRQVWRVDRRKCLQPLSLLGIDSSLSRKPLQEKGLFPRRGEPHER